jgi:hypothetical protein
MIASLLVAMLLSAISPEPILLRSAIDIARIIGLPRMKAFDRHVMKIVYLSEMDSSQIYQAHTRREFFNNYFKLNPVRVK